MTPVFTILLSIMFLKKSYSTMTYISLLPVSKKEERERIQLEKKGRR